MCMEVQSALLYAQIGLIDMGEKKKLILQATGSVILWGTFNHNNKKGYQGEHNNC